jgi:hypothetical protein
LIELGTFPTFQSRKYSMPSFITPKNSIKKQVCRKYLHNSFDETPLKDYLMSIKVKINFNDKFYLTLNIPF